jgi:hypothetical protein
VVWVGVLSVLTLIMVIALVPPLRTLAGSTWREMRSISPAYLGLIVAFKVLQSLFSALTWHNALRCAWPSSNLTYRFVLGVDQGQVALNTLAPARAGTWAMLGIFGLSLPRARPAKLIAVWGVQNLPFALFAGINYLLIAIGLPEQSTSSGGVTDRASNFASAQPLLAGGIVVVILIALIGGAIVAHRKIGRVWQQIREGMAILHPPVRYLRLLFLPSLASYLFNCAVYVALLSAFGIPVTIWTISLSLGSNALAGAVRITPGSIPPSRRSNVHPHRGRTRLPAEIPGRILPRPR